MSTREKAYNIIDNMTEEQLNGFIAMFSGIHLPQSNNSNKKTEAFNALEKLHRHIPNLDEDVEVEEWRKEKYGL